MAKLKKEISGIAVFNSIAIAIAAILFINFILLMMTGYEPSKIFSGLFGLGLTVFTVLYNTLRKNRQILAKILLGIFIVFLISLAIIEGLVIKGANQKTDAGDAIIVLGAGLSGNRPGPLLTRRLNKAIEFLESNPEAICVVTGGQGSDEVDSEANVMARYLIEQGVAEFRIIKEDQATSTIENFIFSKELLDAYFAAEDYKVVYVTNTFHVYRSGLIAEKVGLKAGGLSAPTLKSSELNYYLREYCSLVFYWLFGIK